METCGFCSGRGWYFGRMYDNLGYRSHDTPPRVWCEYCGSSGRCPEGDKLLPAAEPKVEEPRPNEGNPPWG